MTFKQVLQVNKEKEAMHISGESAVGRQRTVNAKVLRWDHCGHLKKPVKVNVMRAQNEQEN